MKNEKKREENFSTKDMLLNKILPGLVMLAILMLIAPFVLGFLFDISDKQLTEWNDNAGRFFGIFLLFGLMLAILGLSVFLLWRSISKLSWFYFLYFFVVFSFFGILFLSSFDEYSNMGRWKPIYPINIANGNTYFFVKTLLKVIIVSVLLIFISAIIISNRKQEQ